MRLYELFVVVIAVFVAVAVAFSALIWLVAG